MSNNNKNKPATHRRSLRRIEAYLAKCSAKAAAAQDLKGRLRSLLDRDRRTANNVGYHSAFMCVMLKSATDMQPLQTGNPALDGHVNEGDHVLLTGIEFTEGTEADKLKVIDEITMFHARLGGHLRQTERTRHTQYTLLHVYEAGCDINGIINAVLFRLRLGAGGFVLPILPNEPQKGE